MDTLVKYLEQTQGYQDASDFLHLYLTLSPDERQMVKGVVIGMQIRKNLEIANH